MHGRSTLSNRWIAVGLLLITVVVYAPVRHHAFLNYDDNVYITANPHVQAGLTGASITWAFTGIHDATWHPLTSLSHIIDYQLFGLNPGPHHLGNVVLHALNTVLLFGILMRMTAQPWRSAFVAALFALHPLHVESVAWVAERKDVLSTFFWMLTMWAYVGYVRHRGASRYAGVVATFTAGLLSKPMVVTLPLVLLLLDVWPLRRVALTAVPVAPRPLDEEPPRVAALGVLMMEKLPLLMLAGIVGVITIIAQMRGGGLVPLHEYRFANSAGNALVSYVAYLGKTLWPAGLAIIYPFEAPLPVWQVFGSAVFLVVVTTVVLRAARVYPYLLTGWLWYVGTLLPVIGLLRTGDHSLADRFTYVPLIGIFVIVAWGVPDLLAGWRRRDAACAVAAAAALAACTVLTSRQLRFWRDSLSIFQHTLAVTRNNVIAHVNVAEALTQQGQAEQAMQHLNEALRINPDYAIAHYSLGTILASRGDHNAAKEQYLAALRADPAYSLAHNNLGLALAAEGDLAGATAQFREALRTSPELSQAHHNLGVMLEKAGQKDAAIAEYIESVRLAPERAQAQYHLAAVLIANDRWSEAIAHLRAALRLEPHFTAARNDLAIALAHAGAVGEAIAQLEGVLGEQSERPVAEITLAWFLATADDARLRDGPRALRLATDAVQRTDQHDPAALNSLAAAYAEVGRFPDAVDTAERALALARSNGRASLARALTDRLTQYRAGQPARDLARGTY